MSPIWATGHQDETEARQDTLKFAEAALTESKREGLLLAVRAAGSRWRSAWPLPCRSSTRTGT